MKGNLRISKHIRIRFHSEARDREQHGEPNKSAPRPCTGEPRSAAATCKPACSAEFSCSVISTLGAKSVPGHHRSNPQSALQHTTRHENGNENRIKIRRTTISGIVFCCYRSKKLPRKMNGCRVVLANRPDSLGEVLWDGDLHPQLRCNHNLNRPAAWKTPKILHTTWNLISGIRVPGRHVSAVARAKCPSYRRVS